MIFVSARPAAPALRLRASSFGEGATVRGHRLGESSGGAHVLPASLRRDFMKATVDSTVLGHRAELESTRWRRRQDRRRRRCWRSFGRPQNCFLPGGSGGCRCPDGVKFIPIIISAGARRSVMWSSPQGLGTRRATSRFRVRRIRQETVRRTVSLPYGHAGAVAGSLHPRCTPDARPREGPQHPARAEMIIRKGLPPATSTRTPRSSRPTAKTMTGSTAYKERG
jgi:hypothetical protein